MNEEPKVTKATEESPGNESAMRVMCLRSWWVAAALALIVFPGLVLVLSPITGVDGVIVANPSLPIVLPYFAGLVLLFVTAAIGGKVAQKPFEVRREIAELGAPK